MNLICTVPPASEPVSLDELMTHARVDDNGDSADLTGKLLAARMHVEDITARSLITSTWKLYMDNWPCAGGGWRWGAPVTPWHRYVGVSTMPVPPDTTAITSIKQTLADGTVQTVDSGLYLLDAPNGRIVLAPNKSWPSDALSTASPICVELVRGWADADHVPQPLKAAILLLAAHWVRNREAVTIGRSTVESMPLKFAVEALTAPYITWRF